MTVRSINDAGLNQIAVKEIAAIIEKRGIELDGEEKLAICYAIQRAMYGFADIAIDRTCSRLSSTIQDFAKNKSF
jgi:hypothetical protein